MEKSKCAYELCEEEFPQSNKTRKYCSPECKNKAKNRRRYYKDEAYKQKRIDAAMTSYHNKKMSEYKRPGELTEQELEHLKNLKPHWFLDKIINRYDDDESNKK